MSYDTRQDYQAQPRYDEPPRYEQSRFGEQQRDEPPRQDESVVREDAPRDESSVRDASSPRHQPPAWQYPESGPTGPSDLDAAEPREVAAPAEAATPVDTPAPVAVGTATPPAPAVAGDTTDETATLWPEDTVRDFQQRWREVQLRFVDDPRAAADEAHELVSEALGRFSDALNARKSELDGWRDTDGADTERMRTVVRRYRILLDRLLEV